MKTISRLSIIFLVRFFKFYTIKFTFFMKLHSQIGIAVLAISDRGNARPQFLDISGIGTRSGDQKVHDAVKYLEDLDKFFSHASRPR